MKNRKRSNQHNQKGVALVIALIVLFLLTALAAALIFATQSEMWATNNYQQLTQSRYAAETGAQMAKNWFENTSNYVTPTSLTSFNTNCTPVRTSGASCTAGSPIVLGGTSANFPTSSVQTNFATAFPANTTVAGVANATYTVTAQLMQLPSTTGTQVWRITSTGSVAGAKTATTQIAENVAYTPGNGSPTFQYAVQATGTACASQGNPPTGITFSSSGFTDSYSSASGAYGGANVVASGGNVYTPGNVNLSGSAEIKGNLVSPNTTQTNKSCSGSVNLLSSSSSSGTNGIGGSIKTLTAPAVTVPTLPSTPSSTITFNGSSCPAGATCTGASCSGGSGVTLTPNATYGNLDAKAPVCLVAGTYNFNSIAASGGNNIIVSSGPITINLGATSSGTLSGDSSGNVINMSGGSSFANPGDNSTNLRINYGGSLPINLSGGSTAAAAVDAPGSPVTLSSGHGDWYGAVICSALNDSGGASIHFDSALLNAFSTGPTTPVVNVAGFTWSKN